LKYFAPLGNIPAMVDPKTENVELALISAQTMNVEQDELLGGSLPN
jgi:hypothetical protein